MDLLWVDGAVRVGQAASETIALGNLLHFAVDPKDGLPLAVRHWQGGLELLMSRNQILGQEINHNIGPVISGLNTRKSAVLYTKTYNHNSMSVDYTELTSLSPALTTEQIHNVVISKLINAECT